MMQTKMSERGEVVIPKKIRDYLGLTGPGMVILEVKEKTLIVKPAQTNIAEKWRQRAKEDGADVSKWVYGDALYEEIF